MKIYVVSESVGEYSDRVEWPSRAFVSQQKAQEFIAAESAKAREERIRTGLGGSSYELHEVELDGAVG